MDDSLRQASTEALFAEIHRRCRGKAGTGMARLGDLTVDLGTGATRWRDHAVHLSVREADVLCALMASHPYGLDTAALRGLIWADWAQENLPRVYVRYLRQKLPGLIPFVRPRGGLTVYRLAVDDGARGAA